MPPLLAQTSVEVRDANGELLRPYTVENGRWRLAVSLDAVDRAYIDMLLAFEDKRFWRHPGVDVTALMRASAQALWHGRVVSGGSTLTMQVARLLENSGTGRAVGKLRQMRLALALEQRLSKEQILELYLLHAPFGGNLEGIRAATRAYFGKDPKRLSPGEAALLVALPQAPEGRRPDLHPMAARAARDRVLARLAGSGHLTTEHELEGTSEPVPETRQAMPAMALHLADRARAERPAHKVHYLSIEAPAQAALETLVAGHVALSGRGLSAAAMVLDHRTGAVLASVGSPGLSSPSGHVDMTRVLRSPGSTLKPLVYGLAFDSGRAHPLSRITDAPVRYGTYAPTNFDGAYRGDVTLRDALQASLNTPVVQLTEMIRPARLVAAMRASGMTPELGGRAPGLAVSLGGVGVTLEDLMRLYGGLARGGVPVPLHWRHGEVPKDAVPFLSAPASWQVSDALAALAPPQGAPARWLAYKTGTSYGHRDAWAIGFDGAHVIGVWLGRPDGTAVPGIFGAELAAPLLFAAAQRLKTSPVPLPPAPRGLPNWRVDTLPAHLRHVGQRTQPDVAGLELVFPPDGALLAQPDVTLKLKDGTPPFAVLVNGTPREGLVRSRAIPVQLSGRGFHRVTVMDHAGAAVSTELEVD
ncbi:penicillin-binding protein 1C [Roseobacteraceae bacterium S113]